MRKSELRNKRDKLSAFKFRAMRWLLKPTKAKLFETAIAVIEASMRRVAVHRPVLLVVSNTEQNSV